MFTWGPQQPAAAPSGPAPVASFFAMRTGTASYDVRNAFRAQSAPTSTIAQYPIVVGEQGEFCSASGAQTGQTFESFSPAAGFPIVYTDSISGVQISVTGDSGGLVDVPRDTEFIDRFSVSYGDPLTGLQVPSDQGTKFIEAGGATAHDIVITFDRLVAAFGLYLIDYGDFGGVITWKFYNGATLLYEQDVQPINGNTGGILTSRDKAVGWISHQAQTQAALFDKVVISFDVGLGDFTGLDNFFVGTAAMVPTVSATTSQSIQFTDTSTNSPTSWLWDFGDSTTSTSQNPTKTYSTPGTYTVTLTATNASGSDSETRTSYIIVS